MRCYRKGSGTPVFDGNSGTILKPIAGEEIEDPREARRRAARLRRRARKRAKERRRGRYGRGRDKSIFDKAVPVADMFAALIAQSKIA